LADVSSVTRTNGEFGFSYQALEFLQFDATYGCYHHNADEDKGDEQRVSVAVKLEKSFARWDVSLANKLERRFHQNREDSWRWRPKLKVSALVGPVTWGLTGFVADELIYNTRSDGFDENRLYLGIEKGINEHCAIELFYCHITAFEAGDPDENIAGMTVKLNWSPFAPRSDGKSK
jgi:hypothetical protein